MPTRKMKYAELERTMRTRRGSNYYTATLPFNNYDQSHFPIRITTNENRHTSTVRLGMQGCIVTSRFSPNGGESRGAPVVKGRSDWFAQCSPGPSPQTIPRTSSLIPLSAQYLRTSDA